MDFEWQIEFHNCGAAILNARDADCDLGMTIKCLSEDVSDFARENVTSCERDVL